MGRQRAQLWRIEVEVTIRHPSNDDKLSVGCLSSALRNESHALNALGDCDRVDRGQHSLHKRHPEQSAPSRFLKSLKVIAWLSQRAICPTEGIHLPSPILIPI